MKISFESILPDLKMASTYTCDGADVFPSLVISEVPEKALSLALIVEDPDAPNGDFVHFILINIPVNIQKLSQENMPADAISLINDFGVTGYRGPCPPSGTHRYYFKMYALDTRLSLMPNEGKEAFRKSINEHILEEGAVMALYSRQ